MRARPRCRARACVTVAWSASDISTSRSVSPRRRAVLDGSDAGRHESVRQSAPPPPMLSESRRASDMRREPPLPLEPVRSSLDT
eukprot:1965532-Prymnesium_polylepis.1